jgi:serine/threonine-protein kinase
VIGETIGNFKIVERLGRGGMGEVYLAEQTSIGTRSAIKILKPEVSADEEHVRRFFNEAVAVSHIQHSGIVKIFDVGRAPGGEAYLIMEYLQGETLAKRIATVGPLPLPVLADIGKQIASVLGATHGAGITHRDLKPDNIYLIPDRELPRGERVKILDFGIAKLTGTLAAQSPQTIGTMGTPAYMAPEQWGDTSKVDWRADVYSLGCVAFEMATGRPPFIVNTIAEACALHLHEVPVRASTIAPVPAALDELLARLLEKKPEARPQSMQEIARAFEAIGEGRGSEIRAAASADTKGTMQAQAMAATAGGSALNVGTMPPAPAPKKSRAALFAIIGVAIAGAGGAAAYVAVSKSGGDTPPKVAHQPPPPAVADAMPARPPPIVIDAAAVVVEPPAIDAGVKRPPTGPAKGAIDRKAVDEILHANQSKFDGCFAGAHGRDATLAPKADLKFRIESDGFVTQESASGLDTKGNNCLEFTVNKLTFPKPNGGPVAIEQALTFAEPAPEEPPGTPVAEVKAELKRLHPELSKCAAKAGVHGAVDIRLSIGRAGHVMRAALTGEYTGSELGACMVPILATIQISKPHPLPINLSISFK